MSSTAASDNDATGYKFDLSDKVVLDPELYQISNEDKQFFKEYVGFKDDAELKEHAFEVRRKAYDVSSLLGFACRSL